MGAKIQTFKDVAKVALRKVVFFCVSVLIVEKARECKRLSILNAPPKNFPSSLLFSYFIDNEK